MKRKLLMELFDAVDVKVIMGDPGRAVLTIREDSGTTEVEIPVKVGWWFSMAIDAARTKKGDRRWPRLI